MNAQRTPLNNNHNNSERISDPTGAEDKWEISVTISKSSAGAFKRAAGQGQTVCANNKFPTNCWMIARGWLWPEELNCRVQKQEEDRNNYYPYRHNNNIKSHDSGWSGVVLVPIPFLLLPYQLFCRSGHGRSIHIGTSSPGTAHCPPRLLLV